MIHGVDLSNNNGPVNIPLLARGGIDFAWLKASEGVGYADAFFPLWWANLDNETALRGAYHFGRPDLSSGHQEAAYFVERVFQSLHVDDVLILDLEQDGGISPDADLLAYTLDFLLTVELMVRFPPILYSRSEYLLRHNVHTDRRLGDYGLWLADYQTNHFPTPPAPWSFIAAWQYGQGPVPGVQGMCDLDLFNGDRTQLMEYGKPL